MSIHGNTIRVLHRTFMTNSQNISLVEQIDQCLPQTQCTLCTYPRCKEYAEALVDGEASINQCPPGGDVTISLLSNLLETAEIPLNSDHGINEPKIIAFIREQECIGCKLCIKACPALASAQLPKLMVSGLRIWMAAGSWIFMAIRCITSVMVTRD